MNCGYFARNKIFVKTQHFKNFALFDTVFKKKAGLNENTTGVKKLACTFQELL